MPVTGTGTPPTSPRFGAPRFSQADAADFSDELNAVVDAIDAKAALLTDARFTDQRVPVPASVDDSRIVSGGLNTGSIANKAVTSAKIADGAVGQSELSANAVTTPAIADGQITTAKIVDGAVTSAKIADGTIALGDLVAAIQSALAQPGDLIASAAASRAGCLLCDGSAVIRTGANAALFAAIGTRYGAGNGVSTFNLPDYRGRALVGTGTGPGLTTRNAGDKFGEETHTLVDAEMPSHAHGGNTGGESTGHSHALQGGWAVPMVPSGWADTQVATSGSSGLYAPVQANLLDSQIDSRVTEAQSNDHVHGINRDGGDAAHNNLQPSTVANIFIKL